EDVGDLVALPVVQTPAFVVGHVVIRVGCMPTDSPSTILNVILSFFESKLGVDSGLVGPFADSNGALFAKFRQEFREFCGLLFGKQPFFAGFVETLSLSNASSVALC